MIIVRSSLTPLSTVAVRVGVVEIDFTLGVFLALRKTEITPLEQPEFTVYYYEFSKAVFEDCLFIPLFLNCVHTDCHLGYRNTVKLRYQVH